MTIASNSDERIHSLVGVLPLLPVLSRHLASCAGTAHRFTDCHIILRIIISSVIMVHKCFVCHFCKSLRSARARTTYKDMRLWQGNVSSLSSSEYFNLILKVWNEKMGISIKWMLFRSRILNSLSVLTKSAAQMVLQTTIMMITWWVSTIWWCNHIGGTDHDDYLVGFNNMMV